MDDFTAQKVKEYGVVVTRNGHGIHVGTWLQGGLTDLTTEQATELLEKLAAVLGGLQPGMRVRSRVTNARGTLVRREDPLWVVRVDGVGIAQGEGLLWHPSGIVPEED